MIPSASWVVQRLNVAILQLDLPCSGPVTYSGEIFNHWQVSGKETAQIFFKRLLVLLHFKNKIPNRICECTLIEKSYITLFLLQSTVYTQ